MLCRGDALDGLVEGQVQRISSGAGDDDVSERAEVLERGLLQEANPGFVRGDRGSREDPGDLAGLGEGDVEDEVVPGHRGDLE